MAGIGKITDDWNRALITEIGMGKYLKKFEDLGINHKLLSDFTIYDLRYDLGIKNLEDSSMILESITNNQSIPKNLVAKSADQADTKKIKIKLPEIRIGCCSNCDLIIDNVDELQCTLKYDESLNIFFAFAEGTRKTYIKLPNQVSLRKGMTFLIGRNEFEVMNIWKDNLGNQLICLIQQDGWKEITFGRNGISFGKAASADVDIFWTNSKIHAVVRDDFILESYAPTYELMKNGLAYPFYFGSALMIDDLEIFFE